MKVYKDTRICCPVCSKELILVQETYYDTFEDGMVLKDVGFYFECPNDCDSEKIDSLSDNMTEIDRIISSADGI